MAGFLVLLMIWSNGNLKNRKNIFSEFYGDWQKIQYIKR